MPKMPLTEFERLNEVIAQLAIKHARAFVLERADDDLQLAQKFYAAARGLPLQLTQRAGNQVTYAVLRELLEDDVARREIAGAMGWPASETPTPHGIQGGVRASPNFSK